MLHSTSSILIFYPHNPFSPIHGSHHRALQQINDLDVCVGKPIIFASTEFSSDTKWQKSHDRNKTRIASNIKIVIFERSAFGYTFNCLSRINRIVGRLFKLLSLPVSISWNQEGSRNYFVKVWFTWLAVRNQAQVVIIHYTQWAFLATWMGSKTPCIMELHDLSSISQFLLAACISSIETSNDQLKLKDNYHDLTYVNSLQDLPLNIQQDVAHEINQLESFDLIWSISHRETQIIRQASKKVKVTTIYPRFSTLQTRTSHGEYAILPIGPNPFNTYSLLRFLERVAQKIVHPSGCQILITGRFLDNKTCTLPTGFNYLGFVDSYPDLLAKAKFMIAPTIVGTGQQMKIFEALSQGVPSICYTCAAPSDSSKEYPGLITANSDQEFIAAINMLWTDQKFYENLYQTALAGQAELGTVNEYSASISRLLTR